MELKEINEYLVLSGQHWETKRWKDYINFFTLGLILCKWNIFIFQLTDLSCLSCLSHFPCAQFHCDRRTAQLTTVRCHEHIYLIQLKYFMSLSLDTKEREGKDDLPNTGGNCTHPFWFSLVQVSNKGHV